MRFQLFDLILLGYDDRPGHFRVEGAHVSIGSFFIKHFAEGLSICESVRSPAAIRCFHIMSNVILVRPCDRGAHFYGQFLGVEGKAAHFNINTAAGWF